MRPFNTAPLHLKSAPANEAGIFTGYASTFDGEPDTYGHLIAPGAFKQSLVRHLARGSRPALLWQHDQKHPIGVWASIQETPSGLLVEGRLTLGVPMAQEAYSLLKDGALGLSIGGLIPEGGAELQGNSLLLKEFDLFEISLVSIPANSSAQIVSVKTAYDSENPNPRDFERAARDALGLSAREAKRLMAGGWSSLVRDEQVDNSKELADIAAKLQHITKSLMGK